MDVVNDTTLTEDKILNGLKAAQGCAANAQQMCIGCSMIGCGGFILLCFVAPATAMAFIKQLTEFFQ